MTAWRILQPTDFSEASELAFAHALKLALLTRGQLHVLHVSRDDSPVRWRTFPGVREALERWGVLPAGSPAAAVGELAIDVQKVDAVGDDPVSVTLGFLERHPADLIVLATHQRDGLARWRQPSIAEPIARHARQAALFVPAGAEGFVDAATGALRLQRILIPVDRAPAPQPAVDAAAELASLMDPPAVTFRLAHVGPAAFPAVTAPERAGWTWERRTLAGDPAATLVGVARHWKPDLIVTTTAGRHGFVDALRGSTTERILRAAPCPLLAVSA